MPRTRSIIIDAPFGRAFANTQSSIGASATQLIAGAAPRTVTVGAFNSSRTLVQVASNIGSGGRIGGGVGGLMTSITARLSVAPALSRIVLRVKVGSDPTSPGLHTVIATMIIPVGSVSVTTSVAHQFTAFDSMYVDVIEAAGTSANRAAGLNVIGTWYQSA